MNPEIADIIHKKIVSSSRVIFSETQSFRIRVMVNNNKNTNYKTI